MRPDAAPTCSPRGDRRGAQRDPRAGKPAQDRRRPARRADLLAVAALALLVVAVFGQVAGHEFLFYDDLRYVTANPRVLAGLTPGGVAWAMTSTESYNWHPLTWLSHMADVTLFGANPAGHHLTSLFLHLAATAALYLVLCRTTGAPGRSAFVAALFGVHPLHVESVAWVAERKDVLSGLLFMLTLLAWRRWVERPSAARYALAAGVYALGLMSKSMLVTVPLVLLLLDYWPLGRWPGPGGEPREGQRTVRALLVEKTPLFALAALGSVLAVVAQARGGAMRSLEGLGVGARVAGAVVAYAGYLAKAIWPADLSVFYPPPAASFPASRIVISTLVLAAISVSTVMLRRRCPYVLVGWLWYIVMLLPVIGLVQVGEQAMADRYTYLPLIGPFLALAWGAPACFDAARPAWPARTRRGVLAAASAVVVAALSVAAWAQAARWHDTIALFRHAVSVTRDNYRAHQILSHALLAEGKVEEAEQHAREAVRLRPGDRFGRYALGKVCQREGHLDEAAEQYRAALSADPGFGAARTALALVLSSQGRLDEAAAELERAVAVDPSDPVARLELGNVLVRAGRLDDAIVQLRRALSIDPGLVDAYRSLAWALLLKQDYAGAWQEVRRGAEHGFRAPQDLLARLTAAMPEPASVPGPEAR